MINPMTGEELGEKNELVLIYGVDEKNYKLLNYLFCDCYDVLDVTNAFSDLLALKASAIIINPNMLKQNELEFLDEIYSENNDTTLMVFTKEIDENVNFKYHVIDLDDESDCRLRILANHMRKRKFHLNWKLDNNFLDSIILVDEEMNGLDQYKDELVCIEAVYVEKNVVKDKFYSLIKPKYPLTEEYEEMTEIRNEQLQKASEVEIVMKQFEEWRSGRTMLVFGEDFIYPFYDRAYACIGMRNVEHIYDLRTMLFEIFPNITKRRLWELGEFCGIKKSDSGVEAMKKLYDKVYKECLDTE